MPVIDRVLSRFGLGRKADVPIINDGAGNLPSVRVIQGGGLGTAAWTARAYDQMATAGYAKNSDVYACVSLIAGAGKQVKWYDGSDETKALRNAEIRQKSLYEGLPEDRQPESLILSLGDEREKEFKAKLKRESNPRLSNLLLALSGGAEFIETWLSYILLSGNDYVEVERRGDAGLPARLHLLRPDRVTANVNQSAQRATERELINSWRVSAYAGQVRTLQTADIVHSKLFNPTDDIYGMAPLAAALLRVDAENEGLTLMKRMLQRGFSPGWIEAAKDSVWEDTQVNQLKERVKNSKLLGEELFLENASWHQMGFNPVDSGVTDQQILSKRDIASVFHVPSVLIGDAAASTYNNYREARRALYMEAVIPLLTQFRDDWNRSIGFELKSPLEFDRDSFDAITAAREEATDRVVKLFTAGVITQDESRSDLEYGPAKPDDVFYAPANMMPLGGEPIETPAKGLEGVESWDEWLKGRNEKSTAELVKLDKQMREFSEGLRV